MKVQSKWKWFTLTINDRTYWFNLDLGRLSISFFKPFSQDTIAINSAYGKIDAYGKNTDDSVSAYPPEIVEQAKRNIRRLS